jgi:energy-coupling factor transport system substrate-specific component
VVAPISPVPPSEEPAPLFLFLPIGILVNVGGVFLNNLLDSPIFLDSAGTIFVAVVLGPWLGAAAGFLSNLIIGLVETPISIPFGIVNAAIGIIAGFLSRRWGFRDVRVVIALILILTVVCPILATPIVVYLFGGVSGSAIDKYWAILMQSGHQVFSSAFLVRLPANLVDKIISAGLVWVVLLCLPPRWRGLSEPKKRQATSPVERTAFAHSKDLP